MADIIVTPAVDGVVYSRGMQPAIPQVLQVGAIDLVWNAATNRWTIPQAQIAGVNITVQKITEIGVNIANTLNTVQDNDWAEIYGNLKNTGLDPTVVRLNVFAFLLRFPVQATPNTISRAEAIMQLLVIVCFVLIRGINFDKALLTTSPTGKAMVDKAVALFAPVFTKQKGSAVAKHLLTPGRVIPVLGDMALVANAHLPNPKFETFKPTADYPAPLLFPGAGMMIPSNYPNLRAAYVLFAWNLDSIFRQQRPANDEAVKTNKKNVLQYANLAFSSTLFADNIRMAKLNVSGVAADIAPIPADKLFDITKA